MFLRIYFAQVAASAKKKQGRSPAETLSSEHHAYLYSLPARLATLFGRAGRPPETWTRWIFLIDLLTVVICSDSCWRAFQVRRAELLYLQRACGLTAPRSRMIPESENRFSDKVMRKESVTDR
jgi:hypothetical protein